MSAAPPEPASPFTPADQAAWDAACQIARHSRGLGFELLAHALPLGWQEDGALLALSPSPALCILAARIPAAKALDEAFKRSAMRLSLTSQPAGSGFPQSWAQRRKSEARAEGDASLAAMAAEPLSAQLAAAWGVSLSPGSFVPHGDRPGDF